MSAGFTKDAAAAARIQEKRHITLIGLDTLFDLWMEHYGKLTDQALRRLPLRPIQSYLPGGERSCIGLYSCAPSTRNCTLRSPFHSFTSRRKASSTRAGSCSVWPNQMASTGLPW